MWIEELPYRAVWLMLRVAGGLVVVGIGAFLYTPVERDQGTIMGEGEVDVFRVRLGDCFDNDDTRLATRPETEDPAPESISSVDGVPCNEPHDNEVYALFDLEFADFPGEEGVSTLAEDGCLSRFAAFVGRAYEESVLSIGFIYPTSESFANRNDREVICYVNHMDDLKLTGSKEDSKR